MPNFPAPYNRGSKHLSLLPGDQDSLNLGHPLTPTYFQSLGHPLTFSSKTNNGCPGVFVF